MDGSSGGRYIDAGVFLNKKTKQCNKKTMPKQARAEQLYRQRVNFQQSNRPIQTLPQTNIHEGTVAASSLLAGRYLDGALSAKVFSNATKSKTNTTKKPKNAKRR